MCDDHVMAKSAQPETPLGWFIYLKRLALADKLGRRIPQTEAARKSGGRISRPYWSQLERGKDPKDKAGLRPINPKVGTLDAIVDALQLSEAERAELFRLAGHERPAPRWGPGNASETPFDELDPDVVKLILQEVYRRVVGHR